MNSNISKTVAAGAAAILSLGGFSLASAQEVSGSADVDVQVRATTSRPLPPRPNALIDLKEDAQLRLQQLRAGMVEQRLETRVEMRNATTADERQNIVREMRENAEAQRDRAAEIRGNVKERLQALVKTHVGAIIRRSENALNMFDNLIERMETRIEKLKDSGADTASVEASLSASVSLVTNAKADLTALKDLVASVTESSNAEDVKAQLRAATTKVTSSIKAAHASLLSTARALVQLSATVDIDAEATN